MDGSYGCVCMCFFRRFLVRLEVLLAVWKVVVTPPRAVNVDSLTERVSAMIYT